MTRPGNPLQNLPFNTALLKVFDPVCKSDSLTFLGVLPPTLNPMPDLKFVPITSSEVAPVESRLRVAEVMTARSAPGSGVVDDEQVNVT